MPQIVRKFGIVPHEPKDNTAYIQLECHGNSGTSRRVHRDTPSHRRVDAIRRPHLCGRVSMLVRAMQPGYSPERVTDIVRQIAADRALQLPVTQRSKTRSSVASPSTTPHPTILNRDMTKADAREYILVIEDEDDVARALLRDLHRAGYHATVARNIDDVFSSLEERTPDVVVVDGSLPVVGGAEICQILRGKHATRKTPILFLTEDNAPRASDSRQVESEQTSSWRSRIAPKS